MLNAKNVADYFVSMDDWDEMTNLKLQKLVYFAYGLYIAKYDEPLFIEKIEAWDYGPVIPELYHELKKFKKHDVSINKNINIEQNSFLDNVYSTYGYLSASQLYKLSHIKNSPWDMVFNQKSSNCIINQYIIQVYFKELSELQKKQPKKKIIQLLNLMSRDEELVETLYVLSNPQDASRLIEQTNLMKKDLNAYLKNCVTIEGI